MFIIDALMLAGIRWTLETVATAADAELNDDSVLRERLLDAEMRRELGELSDDEFREIETDVLARIRAIRERRDGGAAPLAFSVREPLGVDAGSAFNVEATLEGDFHDNTSPVLPRPGALTGAPKGSRAATSKRRRPASNPGFGAARKRR